MSMNDCKLTKVCWEGSFANIYMNKFHIDNKKSMYHQFILYFS